MVVVSAYRDVARNASTALNHHNLGLFTPWQTAGHYCTMPKPQQLSTLLDSFPGVVSMRYVAILATAKAQTSPLNHDNMALR
jgi:hypothetical protein